MTSERPLSLVRAAALAAAILVWVALILIDSGLAGAEWRHALPLSLRAGMLAFGLALVVVGLGGGAPRVPFDWGRGERWALAALTGAAFAVRAWQLDGLRALIDEGNSIDNLFHAHDPGASLLLPPSQYVTTMLHPGWQALVVAAVGPTLAAFRLSSAVLGALTVPALWVLARSLFDRPTAWAAAILLAGYAPHVHFSRVGLPHIGDVLFGTVALAGVARGLAGGGGWSWAVAGVALGLTHYGFEAGRWFFTPLVAVWLGVQALLAPARLRAARLGLAILAAGCGLAMLPLYGTVVAGGGDVSVRLRTSALAPGDLSALWSDPPALRRRVTLAAGVLVWERERAEYYGGDDALLSPWLVPFALLGALLCAARPRAPEVLVPLWVLAAWLANVAMRDPAVFARWVVVFPALMLATARGVCAPLAWVRDGSRRRLPLVAVGLAAALALADVHRYFGRHVAQLERQERAAKPYRDAVDAALRAAAAAPPRADVLLISEPIVDPNPARSLLRLLSDERDELRLRVAVPDAVDAAFLAALPGDRDHLFFVAPDDAATTARLAACFALEGPWHAADAVPPDKRLDLYLGRAATRRGDCGS